MNMPKGSGPGPKSAPDKGGAPLNGVMGKDRTHAGGGDQLGVLSNDLNMAKVAVSGIPARPDLTAGMDKTALFPVRKDNVRLGKDGSGNGGW